MSKDYQEETTPKGENIYRSDLYGQSGTLPPTHKGVPEERSVESIMEEYEKKHLQWKSDGGFNVDNGRDHEAVKDWLRTTLEAERERSRAMVGEILARYIYEQMPYCEQGEKPKWVDGGNSLKQDEARAIAQKYGITTDESNNK
jgi:hypothetical protein